MINGKSVLCRDFENEMWLFISNELPSERLEFWKKHLAECDDCVKNMEEELKIASVVAGETMVDIDEATYNRMINAAVKHNKYGLKNIFGITVEEALGIVKTMYANNKGMYFEETTLTDINYRGGREQLNRGLGFENDDLLWYEKMSSEYRAEWLNEYSSHFTKEDKEFLENKLSEKAIKDKSKA